MSVKWAVSKAPRMTAAHFAYIAEIIREMQTNEPLRVSFAMVVGNRLRPTNPRFNMDAFLTACNPTKFSKLKPRRK